MLKLKLSRQLSKITRNYRFVKDTEGMSPARVYKLIGRNENFYLKISDSRYDMTTYNVEREKDIMLWLKEKLPVPEVLHFEKYESANFLLMREVDGVMGSEDYEQHRDPKRMVKIYSEGIKFFQSVSTLDCPYNNNVDNRLNELDYLLQNKLADVNTENWEDNTPFRDPNELHTFLKTQKPNEELVFSHGDFGDSNIFIREDKTSGFIDLGRSGKADKWYDIAFCVRSIQHDIGNDKEYLNLFFSLLEIQPDWDKINYYILLDELF
ncbi:MAG: aminoglycoside 3'-phosphotransferase [Anaerolineales bacterium]|uniref:APH(3') family aminoglycoside O-phosphotransferase n=1 Tax=Candidatus Villigracilis proximus TaxID=3140683 RepID=UPI003136C142|nr:aminoglycoside 3'-phosphotransferase [Anaerolineales bacterium]